jgi:O-antigen ligase
MRTSLSTSSKIQSALVIALVAWGALAFGAVYPWGYGALACASIVAGVIGLRAGSGWRRVPTGISIAFALLLASILIQQVPLPRAVLERISPATVAMLEQRNIAFATAAVSAWHPLSIDPARTWTGLFLVVSLGALWLGLAASFTERTILRIAGGIATVGLGLAVIGIAGLANHNGKVLGFWEPWSHAAPFGPFINRNHYAGWMLMSIPLGAGYLMSMVGREIAEGPRSWRARVVWLSTRRANRMVMVTLALIVMMLSVLLSVSRSGIVCLAIGMVAFGWFALRKIASRSRRAVAIVCLAALAIGCVGWAGVDRIGSRFAALQGDGSGGRREIWRDTVAVTRAFPVAGTGLDTFGLAMLVYQTAEMHEHYEEAHNDYLQVAAEGGLLVSVPALLLIGVAAYQAWRRFRERADTVTTFWLRAGAVAGLLAIALQEAVEFSLQMPGNAALFCVLAAIAVHQPSARPAAQIARERRTPHSGLTG